MPPANKYVYVISDLHLGGEAEPGKRGFRICTQEAQLAKFIASITIDVEGAVELVVNGDAIDFLAERSPAAPHNWKPFHFPEEHAVQLLDRIAARSAGVFESLKVFLRKGHRLVILPGNHDIELNLPKVRSRLRQHVGANGPADYEFIPHGEAYRVGDVLIEHGNRIDDMNFVDQNALRTFCGLLSRGDPKEKDFRFDPPAGSKLVAELINDIKKDYSFIDLLKPEKEAAIPIILALEPGRRGDLLRIASALDEGNTRRSQQINTYRTNIAAHPSALPKTTHAHSPHNALEESLLRTVKRADFGVHEPADRKNISAIGKLQSFAALLFGNRDKSWDQRLMDLLDALRAFQSEDAFDWTIETDKIYEKEARRLAYGPIRHVVFGHTHLAKKIDLGDGRYYFNSGTWADLLPLPSAILDPTREYAPLAELEQLMKNLISQEYGEYAMFHPTYVHFVQDERGNSISHNLSGYPVEPPS